MYTKKYYKIEESKPNEINEFDILVSVKDNSPSKSKLINKTKVREKDNIKKLFYGKKIEYT